MLARKSRVPAFFDALDRANRCAILWRVQTAKRPETRARRIEQFVALCAAGKTIHPTREKARRVGRHVAFAAANVIFVFCEGL